MTLTPFCKLLEDTNTLRYLSENSSLRFKHDEGKNSPTKTGGNSLDTF